MAGACSSGGHTHDPQVTLAPATTTTTTPLDQIPATIDVPYVQRVMDALDHLTGEAAREFVAQRGPTPKFEQIIEAVYTGQALQDTKDAFGRAAAQPDLTPFNSSPGDPVTTVQTILASIRGCVVFRADSNDGPMLTRPPPPGTTETIYRINLLPTGTGKEQINQTGWWIVIAGQESATTLGDNPCGS